MVNVFYHNKKKVTLTNTSTRTVISGNEMTRTKLWEDCEAMALCLGWGGVSRRGRSGTRPVSTTAERLWPHDAAILFLGMHATPVCTSVHQKMLTRMFTAALLTLALNWTQPYAHRENGDVVPQWTILQQRRWTIYPQEHGQISYAQCRMEVTRYKRVCTV